MTLELTRQNAEHQASQQQEWQQLSQWLLLSFIPGPAIPAEYTP